VGRHRPEAPRQLARRSFVAQPLYIWTNAITIHVPAAQVWPWLVQLGQGRGGLYSYDWLENLIGCDVHSADRILPRAP
jgi:hypothetical protein